MKDTAYQNNCVFGWAMAVQKYSFRVEDIPGKENIEHYIVTEICHGYLISFSSLLTAKNRVLLQVYCNQQHSPRGHCRSKTVVTSTIDSN